MKFLSNNFKHFVVICFSVLFLSSVYAATTDLAVRFLDKANEAFEDDNIEDAYKYVNQALAVAKDEDSFTNVIYFAQSVYKAKLLNIQKNYDDMALIDIKMNLEKYPSLENTTIKKLIKQIEQDQLKREQNSVVDFTSNVDIDRIAKNLNGMKPNYAADILVAMDEKTTIQVLQKIEEISGFETVSQIISSLPSDKAAEIRELINSHSEKSDEKNISTEKKPELTSFNGIAFGSSREEAKKIMFNKGWKLESSSSKNPYTSDTYINGTYAGLTVSYISLYFFNDQLWQGYVQIKTENSEPVNRVLGTLQEKYGLVALKGKDTVKNGANFKCVDSVNGNWIDIQMTVINDKKIWYWYDISFYSQELSKIQETYNMVESVNNLKVHEDDL